LFSFLGKNLDLIGFMSPSEIPGMISRFSIGIMPLEDTEFNRGKSALKLVEYLGAGVPVVPSDIGENARVVRAPEFGMLATTPQEWQEALTVLLTDGVSRHTKGEAGRNFVRTHYDRIQVYSVLLDELRERLFASSSRGLHGSQ